MQRSAATPTQPTTPFFSSFFGGGGGGTGSSGRDSSAQHRNAPPSPTSRGPPGPAQRPTSSGDDRSSHSPRQQRVLQKDRKPSFGRKASFFTSSPGRKSRRRADSAASTTGPPPPDGYGFGAQYLDSSAGPPLPDPSPKTTTDGFGRMLSRGAVTPVSGYPIGMAGTASVMTTTTGPQSELVAVHQHIQETATKRISTLDYLRKAHEGRIYWFNTLLFDKPDLQRMPHYDARKLGRRATNYLLLGISLPAVLDLNSSTPVDFLRSLNALLAEFDAFQQIHTENGVAASSLTRNAVRIPQMFRRATAPVSKGRRSSSSATAAAAAATTTTTVVPTTAAAAIPGAGGVAAADMGYALEQIDSNNTNPNNPATAPPLPPTTITTATTTAPTPLPAPPNGDVYFHNHNNQSPASVMAFGASECLDLLPGEEYSYLLTPTLPFDPDFFETFATLCDALIDTYARLVGLVAAPRDCGGPVGELFAKADGRIRKLFVQGVVREVEEAARAGVKGEVASVGRVVLSGLM